MGINWPVYRTRVYEIKIMHIILDPINIMKRGLRLNHHHYRPVQRMSWFIPFLWLFFIPTTQADVVRPALIEISAYTRGDVEVEIRLSIEALITGINARYKNTQESPQATEYDNLRKLDPGSLTRQFESFKHKFLDRIQLSVDKKPVLLTITAVDIPEPGYVKVPRISRIKLSARIDSSSTALHWYYPEAFGDNAVRVRQVDVNKQKWHWSDWQWLRNDKPSQAFSLTEIFTHKGVSAIVSEYLPLGFYHIIPAGMDHILFILGIFLLSPNMRPLLWQVTMFTIAHTITLGLSMNSIITLPAHIVEPLIALSIAYVGIENILSRSLHKSRLILVFMFGLLHGLGFADALSEFGMPENNFISALVSFNMGVELGQLTIILFAYFGITIWFKSKSAYRKIVIIPISLLISMISLYWFIDRLQ